MNYNEFETKMRDTLESHLGPEISVLPDSILKNNGVLCHRLRFSHASSNVAPCISVDDAYEALQNGTDFQDIVEEILTVYQESLTHTDWDVSKYFSFSEAKEQIVYQLVNYEKNKTRLEQIPHIPYLDLAITFRIHLSSDEKGLASMPVTYDHLKFWKKTAEELYAYAHRNTCRIFPLLWGSVPAICSNICEDKELLQALETGDPSLPHLYVATNSQFHYGANCILYDQLLTSVGEKLNENFYVIPSSTHEVLFLPESDVDFLDLYALIQSVNETQVPETEVLADHPYFYDRKERVLRIAEKEGDPSQVS